MSALQATPIADILDKAAEIIEPEGAWTQHYYARGKSGNRVSSRRAARCFCALGAINFAAGHNPDVDYIPAIHALEPFVKGEDAFDVPDWNDAPERTQAEVVAKLREAAAKAREQGL